MANTADRVRTFFEKWTPALAGALACGMLAYIRRGAAPPATIRDVFTAVINVAAIAVGFLAAAKAILISISQSKTVRWLKQADVLGRLVKYLMTATWALFALAVGTSLLLFIETSKPPSWFGWVFDVWCGAVAFCGAAAFRVMWVFGEILERVQREP